MVESRRLTWRKPARTMPSISTRKLKFAYGSTRCPVCAIELSFLKLTFGYLRSAIPDTDAHNDELGRIRRPHANFNVQTAERALAVGIQRLVYPDVEGLLHGLPDQTPIAPDTREKVGNRAPQLLPQPGVVRFEDRPADALLNGFFQEQEQTPDIDVLPVGVGRGRACSPENRTPTGTKDANHIDAFQVQDALVLVIHRALHIQCAVYDFIGWGLVNAPGRIHTRHDAAYVARGRNSNGRARSGWRHHQPRIVKR